jgi:MOSC domain-containing protein YiiM
MGLLLVAQDAWEGAALMFEGRLVGIYIAERPREVPRGVEHREAVAGQGLEGDRYFRQEGTFSKPGAPDREVTLIEIEAIEALAKEYSITVEPPQARRNLVTQGVPLNHLVGKEFTIGAVRLCGLRLCEPCGHLEKLTVQGIKDGLKHRGGLRAQIVQGGTLRQGDVIRLVSTASVPAEAVG